MASKKDVDNQIASDEIIVDAVEQPQKVDFIVWWSLREKKIPEHHYREIIKADFKARGLSDLESMEAFDNGLKMYGLDIN